MAVLQHKANGEIRRYLVGGSGVSIGRQLGNVIRIDDTMSSRFHCVVEQRGPSALVRDLKSRNGTKVNGQPIREHELHDGDVIQIGRTKIVFAAATATDQQENKLKSLTSGVSDKAADDLKSVAESLPSKDFHANDLQILNTRGQVVHHAADDPSNPEKGKKTAEAVTLLRMVLLVCFRTRASDVHVEPKQDHTLVRARIDGTLVDIAKLNSDLGTRLMSLVKILCDIDIGGRNIIQEGSFAARVPDRRVDYRVSYSPSVAGQKLVIRVLDEANAPRYLFELDLPDNVFGEMDTSMRRDSGMILVCGPTGSGKTATLYATLRSIDSSERNVVTIEDPVEIRLEGITQMPVDEKSGSGFAELLRSTLRQDPDVILVGEIRDNETAKTAVQAAMTGHLVLSTVHARDTVSSVFRLMDLGVEPFALANGLQNLISQRLVRRLCPACKVAVPISDADKAKLGDAAENVTVTYRPHGCTRCLGTGFSGRRGCFELLTVNDDVRNAITSGEGQQAVIEALKGTGYRSLRDAGRELVAQGITTMEELDRVLG